MGTDKLTWRFEAADEMTAANTIEVVNGFSGTLVMEPRFSHDRDSIVTLVGVTLYPNSSLEITASRLSNNKRSMELDVNANFDGDYTAVFTFTLAEGGTRARRGLVTVATVTED